MSQQIPTWFWVAAIPVVGGLGIIYAGHKTNRSAWLIWGMLATSLGVALSSSHLLGFVWLAQIAIACGIKDNYLKTVRHNHRLEEAEAKKILPKTTQRIEINNCSKDELVHGLGLPIVYANEIESARYEGHIFTHVEELMDIAGIPDSYLARLESLVIFSYDINKEANFSWRRCNSFSEQELVSCNLKPSVAAAIVRERNARGSYQSFPDLRRRTGLTISDLKSLL